eukprot:Pgem_evm1s7778
MNSEPSVPEPEAKGVVDVDRTLPDDSKGKLELGVYFLESFVQVEENSFFQQSQRTKIKIAVATNTTKSVTKTTTKK